ncbi:MAG: chromate transporter [Chloroflexi bacterium]|nr:chromate transporter [Chloroflexota bacterium]
MPTPNDSPSLAPAPTHARLFLTWLRIGATSYGGGAIVQYLIQENFIHKHRWLSAEEYARILAMCQITPGLTLIAISITIGKRLGGWPGIVVSLAGLVLPSAAITVAMTAVYSSVRELPPVQAALRTVFAAIVGVSLATSWRNIRPILAGNRKRGPGMLLVALGILAGSAAVFRLFNPPVIWLYLLGGLCGAAAYAWSARRAGGA